MKKQPHKKAPKRLKKQSTKKNNKLFIAIVVIGILILFITLIGAYVYLNNKQVVIDIQKENIIQVKENKTDNKAITFEEKTKALEIEYIANIDNNIYIEKPIKKKKEEPVFHYEEPDYGKIGDIEHPVPTEVILDDKNKQQKIEQKIEEKPKKETQSIISNKPKLAIIIDDVTTKSQIKKIKNIGYSVNMSFLPPTKGHRNSAKIVQNLDNYMIHLPLQASSSRYEEADTLYITDTKERIDKKIASLKTLYPKANFINNHTGSKFTANKQAMDRLFSVLKKYNYTFVDSRTTAKSVASYAAKKHGVKMFSRNIFLDNNKDKKYIQNQLKKAIKSAKKYGTAIAIGHPYNITFQTLEDSKHLLKDLELVYVDKL